MSYEVFLSGRIYPSHECSPLLSTPRPLYMLAPPPFFACSCLKFQLKRPGSENLFLTCLTQQLRKTSHNSAGNAGIWMVKVIKQLFLGYMCFSICMLGFNKVFFFNSPKHHITLPQGYIKVISTHAFV